MLAFPPHRRAFLDKLRSSAIKRRFAMTRWIGRLRGRDRTPIECRYLGAVFGVYPGEHVSDNIAAARYEWRGLKMTMAACRAYRPALFVDVGANVGVYACILAKAGVARRVVAYEPDRKNFARLTVNIDRNSLTGVVEARPCAVGAKRGTALLTPGPDDNAGLSKINGGGSDAYRVDVVALDDELPLANSAIVAKIDVEDYEPEVLAGAERLFSCNFGFAQIEARGDNRANRVIEAMTSYGWTLVDRYGIDLSFERPAFSASSDR